MFGALYFARFATAPLPKATESDRVAFAPYPNAKALAPSVSVFPKTYAPPTVAPVPIATEFVAFSPVVPPNAARELYAFATEPLPNAVE